MPSTTLLNLVFSLGYVKTSLIEEPLGKYAFIKKEKELKALYVGIADAMKQYTASYLERNEKEMLKTLKVCYDVDWMSYKTLQPVSGEGF